MQAIRVLLPVMLTAAALAQAQPAGGQRPAPIRPEVPDTAAAPAGQTAGAPINVRPNYVLGPGDQLLIRVPEAEEINERPFRVDSEGNIDLPLVGAVKASGMTVEEFEAELTKRLLKYIRSPKVSVSVAQYRSDPVFLTGAFVRPGIYGLQGERSLLEMLASAGGLQANSSKRIRITRRLDQGKIPLPAAIEDPDTKVSTVEISINRLMESTNAAENIALQPYDVLYVARAEMVYLNIPGGKAGAFPVDDRESLSVVQLLSIAGGMPPNAQPEKAKVLRPVLNTSRRAEIPLNVKSILEGKANDYPLMPNDVLVIPTGSRVINQVGRYAQYVIPAVGTSLIWAAFR